MNDENAPAMDAQESPRRLTREELTRLLEAAEYKFAKTMPRIPHWYTLRKTWADERLFEAAVQAIRDYGVKRKFGKAYYTYFDAGDYMYWSMGWPVCQTILINRALRR